MHKERQKERLAYIDSLKGICVILIYIFHFQLHFAGTGYIGWHCQPEAAVDPFAAYFKAFPYSILTNNSSPLFLFFAIIGFLPSLFLFRNNNRNFLLKEVRIRYFRFLPLIFISCLTSYFLIQYGLCDFNGFFRVTGNEWIRARGDFTFTMWDTIKIGLFTAFTDGTQLITSLWCMQNIFLGSYFVYAFLLMFGSLKHRWLFYLLFWLLILFCNPYYLSFLSGIIAADFAVQSGSPRSSHARLRVSQSISQENVEQAKTNRHHKLGTSQGLMLVILGCLFCIFPPVLLPPFFDVVTANAVGVLLILMGMQSPLQDLAFHRSRFLAWCSRESLPLIVIQMLVQLSLNIMLFLRFHQAGMDYALNIALQLVINLFVTGLLTLLYSKTIAPLTQKLCKFVLAVTDAVEE